MDIAEPSSPPPFPFHQISGTSAEVGEAHGHLLADRIAIGVEHYRADFRKRNDLQWDDALRYATLALATVRDYDPELLEEIGGIADGSGHSIEEIMLLNSRTGALRYRPECSTAGLQPEATATGHTIVCGNWDSNVRLLETSAVLEIRQQGRPAVLTLTEAGGLMRTGFNEHGIGITGNSLVTDRDNGSPAGIPWSIARRRALRQRYLSAAMGEILNARRGHSGNHLLGSAEGMVIDLEVVPGDAFPVSPTNGIVAHTNHFLSPGAQAKVLDKQWLAFPCTILRLARLEQALRSRNGSISITDIQTALRDHVNHPKSVCTHPDPERGSHASTIASHITDLTARTLWLTTGPPCQGDYRQFTLA